MLRKGGSEMQARRLVSRGWLPRLIVLSVALLAACAPAAPTSRSSAPASGGSGAAQPSAAAPASGAAARPAGSARATVVLGSEPISWSPYGDSASPIYGMLMHVLEPLVLFNDKAGENEPHLAVSWTNLDDHTWEFKLRQGVRFSDGGEFTADDVVHSYLRIRDGADSKQQSTLKHIERIEAADKYTVRLTTKIPDAALPFRLNNRVIGSKAAFDRAGSQEAADKELIGTGPYIFKEWVQGQRWVVTKNPNYWGGSEKAPFDEIVFRSIKEPQAAVTALINGEVDVIPNVPPQLVDQIANNPNTQIAATRGSRLMFLGMHTTTKPWDNQKLRQAVNYAIDREGLVKGILAGRAYTLNGPIGPGMYAYDANLQPQFPYDPARARQLLAEAGYPNGLEVELQSPNGRYLKDKEVAEAIVSMLGQVGIRARLTTPEWGKIWPDIQAGRSPFYLLGRGSVEDPSEYLHQYFRTGVTPRVAFSDPEVDAALDAEQKEFDPARRVALLRRAMSLIQEKAPMAFLFQYEDTYGVSRRLEYRPRGDEYVFAWDMKVK
jgi:peptide/nickel transport system substrate-binding protein